MSAAGSGRAARTQLCRIPIFKSLREASLKLALCYGTRPQTIKASVLRRSLARIATVMAVDTGQHYEFALNGLLQAELDVAPPDHFLEVGSGSHAEQTAAIVLRCGALLAELRPDAVVVIGDTNSTVGCALAATKLRIPVVHVEAGLRAADALMPEELNRRITDAIASVLCAPTASAATLLARERPDGCIVHSGDVARDVLLHHLGRAPMPGSIHPRAADRYLFATLHRAELTDDPATLCAVLSALESLPLPTLLALHPRTRTALDRAGAGADRGALQLLPAVGYLEALALVGGAAAVITDSGGLQREAYWLGVPCITIRGETEWVETIAHGANRLVPPREAGRSLHAAVTECLDGPQRSWDRGAYGDGHASERICLAVAGWFNGAAE